MIKSENKYLEEPQLDGDIKPGKHGKEAKEAKHKTKKKRLTCKQIIESIYDKKEGTILNRTPKDWVFLIIFFLVFYVFLFGYFALLLFIFIAGILQPNTPFRTGSNSLIGAKSSLSFNPVIDTSTLINVSTVDKRTEYLKQVRSYLRVNLPAENARARQCNGSTPLPASSDACQFSPSSLGPCLTPEMFNESLCVYMRLNNIYGWLPDILNSNFSQDILLNCTGASQADTARLGQFDYYPGTAIANIAYGSISNVYYPFLNQSTYGPPIVALHFRNLTRNVVISVNCTVVNLKNANTAMTFSLYLA